jgi:hypothetical protein
MYRRERNRASALEAYYRGKARRTELESQLRGLKEEDAALRALAAMAQLDTRTAGNSFSFPSLSCCNTIIAGSGRHATMHWASAPLTAR